MLLSQRVFLPYPSSQPGQICIKKRKEMRKKNNNLYKVSLQRASQPSQHLQDFLLWQTVTTAPAQNVTCMQLFTMNENLVKTGSAKDPSNNLVQKGLKGWAPSQSGGSRPFTVS